MKHDDRLDELMGNALREVDPVPPAPREEMWARIQAERSARSNGRPDGGSAQTRGPERKAADVLELRPRRGGWIRWSTAIAATLVVGVGLGRISMGDDPAAAPDGAAPMASVPGAEEGGGVPAAYRVAATQHLARTETLLAALAVDARAEGPGEMSTWASELLTDTRLLLSSPAAADPATRRLLEDLDLVLSQIASIPAARAEQEVELIQDGINQSDVLLRLHAATAGPRLVGT